MELARGVRLVAGGLGLLAFAVGRSAIAEEARATCPPALHPIVVDGDLEDWDRSSPLKLGEANLVRKDPSYGGPADLSGEIYLARSATTLYIAGEIHDDTLFWNHEISWLGDGVEVFLDFHPHPEARTAAEGSEPGYDTYAHQLLLHPLANQTPWRFEIFRGRPGRLDDEVDGVQLAGLPLRDNKGATIGYRFELALPLANFPAAPSVEGEEFGLDVALSDSDGRPEQKNYATWSRHSELSRFPGRFGRVTLGRSPPPLAAPPGPGISTVGPLAVLVALLGALLFLWLGQVVVPRGAWLSRRLDTLRAIPIRWKVGVALLLVALIGAAGLLAGATASAWSAADLAQKRRIATWVRGLAEETAALHVAEPQLPLHPSPLISLLAGKSIKAPLEYEFTVIPPVAEDPHRTLTGTPFLRRDLPASSTWSGSFVVHPTVLAAAATIVFSWHPDRSDEKGAKSGQEIAEVRLYREDATVDSHPLRWGREVDSFDDPAAGPSAHPGAPEARVALVTTSAESGPAREHADEVTWKLAESPSPVRRVEIVQVATGGTLVIHGATLTRAGGGEAVPLPLGRPTLAAVPTCASPFPSATQGLQLSREEPRATIACDAAADRIWLVASLRRGYVDARYRAPVLLVEAVFDDGSVDGPFRLENGVSIDAESTPARQHGEAYTSQVAFEWGLPGQPRRHFDAVPLELDRPGRRLVELQFEFKGEDEVVRISSITAGKRADRAAAGQAHSLDSGEDGFRLGTDDLARIEGLTFTLFRDGSAVATTAAGDLRDRTLARTVTPDLASAASRDPEGLHEVRVVEGRRLHALTVGLPSSRILELTWSSDGDRRIEENVAAVRGILALLLAPLIVLIVADAVLSVRSLHVRLVAGFAAAAAAPVALGWFAVPLLVGSSIEGRESEAATVDLAAIRGRLAMLRSQARQRAEAALRDESLQEALRRRGSTEFRASVAAALRDLERGLGPGARLALEVLPLSSAGEPIVFPQEVQWTVFADRTATLTDELAYRQSRLTATGVAQQYDTSGDWRTTLVVQLPLDGATLIEAAAAAGGGAQVLLSTPRGYPLASTLEIPGEDRPEEMEHKQQVIRRVLSEQQPVIETRVLAGTPHTVAYDVLRGEAGIVGLVGAAVPRSATESLLRRIGSVALFVFGAGVAMQFLLAGIVVSSTSKPFLRTLSDARAAAGGTASSGVRDELGGLEDALAAIRAEREAYRADLTRLADAVPRLAAAEGPDAVVERALAIVRESIGPWGALIVASSPDGRSEVLGGFRGAESVRRGPAVVTESHPLAPVIDGLGELHVEPSLTLPEISVRGDRPLLAGASRIDAWPLADPARAAGALLLLAGPAGESPARAVHGEFVATFSRHVGLALTSARLVRMAVHDPDTNAYVPGFFDERLSEEVDRAVTGKQHIALVLVRATGLPPDPSAGRRALQQLAEALRESSPARAFTGRLETDLLALASPETDRAAADAIALALRRSLAERGLADLRVRIGIAACPEDAGSLEFLRAEARRGLGTEDGERGPSAVRPPDDRERLAAEAREIGAIFRSDTGLKILETVERIAGSDIALLIEGETGSGKEVVAELVHEKSGRRGRPMVKVNCAALPDALLESELFGYERGAFTGAERTKPGRFELADGGTIFLDEIGDMPLGTQVKLLRVLEDRAVEHLGGTAPTPIDVRVIAATNRDLRAAMVQGRFREDLYYRLSAVTIAIPPLRARKEDIPPLAERFVQIAAESNGRPTPSIAPDAMDLLYRHPWAGNVRELRNVIEQAVVLSTGDVLRAADFAPALAAAPQRSGASNETARREFSSRAPDLLRGGGGPGMSDRQRRLLAMLSEREWVTNADYCDSVGVSQRTGLRDLQELLERGVIVMEGKRRGARYRLR